MPSAISCQITSIGELLRSSGNLSVPPYQRNYAWEEEHYSYLWDDIQQTFNDNTQEYFLGSVVIDNSTAPDLTIIDGQQRVTTTTIMICALKWHLLTNNLNELATLVSQDFLSRPDYDHHSLKPNLQLNLNDREFFERYIIDAHDPKLLNSLADEETHSPSNLQLARCYIYMCKRIEEFIKARQSLETVANDIITALREKVFLIRIEVEDDLKAFTLFEALNNRGVELSEADLLKNLIFSKAETHIEELKDNWEIMSQNLGHFSLLRFLKHHWNAIEGNVPNQGLFAAIKKRILTPEDALTLSNKITQSSEYYGAIIDTNHDLWQRVNIDKIDEIKILLNHLSLMRAEQCYILLMTVMEFMPENFYDYLLMVRNFTFRYTTIGGKSTSNAQRAYMKSAHAIRQEDPLSAQDCFNKFFADLYPHNNQFQSTFSKKSIRITALARHILSEINNNIKKEDEKTFSAESLDIDLEHILPKKYKDHWQENMSHFKGGPQKYVHRLGNMTLISPELNRRLGNSDFITKKQVYQHDSLAITEGLLDEPIWSADAISRRQNWLASEAVKIWRYPLEKKNN